MANIPIKKLQINERDDTTLIDDIVRQYTERAVKANARLAKGYLDAPCIEEAISLGSENLELNGGSPAGDPYLVNPIYKINVPGYFYRQRYKGDWTSDTVAGVLVASSPSDLSDTATRMVYVAGSDGTIGHANNMFPILPGKNTYAYIVRNTGLRDRNVTREWLFVPTVLAASLNIRPGDYVSVVGGPTTVYPLTGSAQLGTITSIFNGSWGNSFKSVCGFNVADEDEMSFLSKAKDRFIADRIAWIKGLGARLSDYGYTEPTT